MSSVDRNSCCKNSILIAIIKNYPKESLIRIAALVSGIVTCFFLAPVLSFGMMAAAGIPLLALPYCSLIRFLRQKKSSCGELLFKQFKSERSISKVQRCQNAILVLEAAHDHNGAFRWDERAHFRKMEKGRQIAFQTISTLGEFNAAINLMITQGNTIEAIYIRVHATPDRLDFGAHSLTAENRSDWESSLKQLKNVKIILSGCSAGQTSSLNPKNIAEHIAEAAPGCEVIAPAENLNRSSFHLGIHGTVKDVAFMQAGPFGMSTPVPTRRFVASAIAHTH